MSGSSHGTGTSNTNPWKPQQPYLKEGFGIADQLYDKPLQYYGGNTVAGFSPEQMQAQELVRQRAMNGSQLQRSGSQALLDTINGKYLDPSSNPYLNATYQNAYDEARPGMNGQAVAAGRYGSTAWGNADATLQSKLATGIYGGAYNNERNNMMQAIAGAPAYAQSDYNDMSKLAAVGEEKQNMSQALIDEAMKRYNFGQMEGWQRAGMRDQLVSGNYGGSVVARNAGGK